MNRYIVFSFSNFYPMGGAKDYFSSTDDLDVAKTLADKSLKEPYVNDCAHVMDTEELSIVYEVSKDSLSINAVKHFTNDDVMRLRDSSGRIIYNWGKFWGTGSNIIMIFKVKHQSICTINYPKQDNPEAICLIVNLSDESVHICHRSLAANRLESINSMIETNNKNEFIGILYEFPETSSRISSWNSAESKLVDISNLHVDLKDMLEEVNRIYEREGVML